ncbi:IgGFc-binding protein-like isoform X3 [Pelodiscus sinensis]|uniref:IgGFc-binding protein-like isoform X3 n=1 Tax=Pelodiscus sinensis TaxID=13735 RepID=UPI003F6BA85B
MLLSIFLGRLKQRETSNGFGPWDPGTAYIAWCDFNNNSRPFCDWTLPCKVNQGAWIRTKHATPTMGTGPDGDYPDGSGYFIYQEASNLIPFDTNRIESPEIVVSGDICIDFQYHMSGSEDQNELKVIVQNEGLEDLVWSRKGNQSSSWMHGFTTVPFPNERRIKVIFEAVRGLTEYGDTAVDNVGVRNGPCGDGPTTTASPGSVTTSSSSTSLPPPSSESCVVAGDPHYYTFDKQTHHFMGTCAYTLSKLCDANSTLPNFNVEAENEHRGGNTHVSYVRSVNVDVYGLRITLEKGRAVKVNGEGDIIIPFAPSPGVQISSSGLYVVVSTDFGLTVKFDGDHRVEVTLPGSFEGKVCGMCGNYNGNATDDFLNPDGALEPDSTSLGNSWQVSNHTSCPPAPGHDPVCDDSDKQIIASGAFCGLLTDVNGPFRKCHPVLDPNSYFSSCFYDQCELQMDPDSLCKSLQAYADACRAGGAQIDSWRNATFCPILCQPNSHYEACTAACPATCANPRAPASCSLPCVEGCVCDSGYLLYNDGCVPSSQCGCWHNGKHYPVGAEFWTDDTCSSKCRCPSQGSKVTCSSASCPSDHYCGVQNGEPGCYPETYGICRVHNDPHYNTFDRETHHFMGICTYTLAKECVNSSSLPYFNIEAKNEHRGNPTVSYVQKVLVEVYGEHIEILKNHPSQVLVNKVLMTLPVSAVGGSITVSRSGRYVTLETDFRLRVSYDTDHSVEVRVPTTYFNSTCGMCGNFNNRRDDDYMMPDGQQAKNSNELGNSWRVRDDDPSCDDPVPPDICPVEKENLYKTDRYCGLITKRLGPFAACHSVINPESFFESCVYDLCALNGSEGVLCRTLEAYADACQTAGVMLSQWRNATFCPPTCHDSNSHYEPCMTACPATCLDRLAPENCSKPCVEGCACNSGFVLSGGTCVPVGKCGCVFQDRYYSEGESVVTEDCTSRCQCLGNGNMTCSALSCQPHEICKIQNGLRGCYPPSTATCHIYGDPHYTTFDGKLHHFQGACNYTVVETCNNSSGGFKLTTRNEHRGNPSWTAINSVALTLQGVHIALRKNRIVYINGALASPPVTPLPGVTVSLIGHYVHVTTPLGLQLQFNGDHELFVRVTEKHKGSLCGLCGTYTGTQQDDFTRPDGVVVADVNEFGASWSVPDDEWPCNSTVAPPVTCSSSEQQAAEGRCRILTDRDGPFAPCHAAVPPHLYFESCVYDQCAAGGSSEQLCNDLESYATACAEAGVSLGEWTAGTICATISSTVEPSISPSVTNATVPPGHCTMSCSFDDGFCDWTQSISDTLDWKRHRGPTDSPNTGPSYDHTTGDGYFIYLQGSEAGQGDRAHLVSPVCSASGPHCFRFWYHMFGVARAMALRVYVQDDGDLEMVWSQRGNNGDRWNFAEVTVHNRGNMLILLEGERGEDFRSDLAVDDVSLVDGYCPGDEPTTTASTGSVTTSSSSGTTTSLPPPSSGGSPTTGSPTTEKPCQTGRGTCSASGDPHYNTFDGRVHHFMGNCTYTLSKVCNASRGLPPFDVSTTNEHRGSNTKVSYVKSVNVDVYGTQISLLQNRKVNVNGTRRNLPVDIENKIKIKVSGGYVLLETDFGLWVRFDGNHYAEVSVPCDYQGQLCGLCGNYNGDPKDDNRKPNGSIAADSTELGESWLAVENNTVCSPDESGICDPELESEARKNTACGMITDPTGIFKDCHAHVAPDQFLENCVYDWCYTDDKTASLCHGLQAYAESCTNAGVCREWRNSTLCSISCAEGSQYKSCGSRCPSSCMTPSAFSPCSSLPVEGCFCKKGYTLSGDTCVPESECGCVDENNHYHQLNESWFPRDTCKERCSCHGNNSITCTAWECGALEECRVQDGVLGCYPSEGCRFNCSFDDNFCEWTQSTSDDFDWRRISVAPPYGNISHGGYYISTDSRYARPEEKGQLISPHCTARQAACFRFRYHVAGVADDGALKVYLLQEADGKPLLLWLTTGSKGDSWLEAAVDLHISGRFQVVLEGVTGTDNRTRVSVDDVFLDPGCCLGEPSTTSSPTTVGTSPTGESPTTGSPTSEVPCQTGRGTCSASGDPHYNTFDGRVHHFMGNCTYTLSKVCNASGGLPPFDVSTTNEHRGSNTKVSYVKSVNVDVYGTQISLLQNRKVNVNGTRRNLPVEIENKIKIQVSGGYVLLETDFGLWVRFDGNHYAEVSVPCDYRGQLCGLCGNYNGDPKDDNRKPNGSIAADSTELGESWLAVENNTVCSPDESGICHPELESEARKNTACGMITDPTGIFKDCHAHVAPDQFLENCVYDWCYTDDKTASLCHGLQAYAESCTNAGVCREWRNSTLCSISCAEGSQYKSCGSRCPSSCMTPSAFSPCSSLPVEGCFCKKGYTLSGDTCVPESECGCVDENNHYHQLNESWFPRDTCKERCSCHGNNSITCTAWECGALEECRVQDGVLGCYPSEGCRFNCSFDDNFCEWTQSTSDDFDWRRISVAPPYGNISHGGYYISTDSRYARPEEKGQLISPHCTARQAACFRFRYHVAGVADDGALKVYLLQEADGKPLLLWLTTGSKGDSWLEAAVDLHISGRFQVVLEGVTGTDNRTRVSVDDVFLDPGCCLGEPSTTSSPTTVGTSPTGESPTTGSPTSEVPCQTGRGTCSASGDPHYNTFDGRVHHFMGNCTYTLSKVCNASGGLPPFDVSTTNEHRGSNTKVSYVKSVNVDVYGTQISLLQNRKVNVNGTRRNLPVEIENKIKIQVSGGYVLLETDFGLWVRFDGNHYAEVSVPCDYRGQLCGLCGNYNGDPKDDNRKPNGSIAADSTELGESWLAVENNTVCSPDESGICHPELESEARKNTACGMITDPTGIFKDCHAHVAPDQFLENCVYDWCYTDDKTASLCHGLQAYAESCTNAGVCREWRNSTLCSISCAEGSQYKSCGSRCPSSCMTPSAFSPCSSLPVEGCFCKKGYTLSGDTCVPESECGCVDENNHYHQLNESWFPRDTCKERCSCHGNNSITCTAWECGALEECRVQDGVLGCYPSEGCRFNCSFDDNFCEWTQSTSDDFDWRRISVAPPYGNISHGGYYISTDSRYARPEEKGQLISPHCTARQAACFRFRYHVAGVADDGALKVYLLQEADGKPLLLWLTTGSKGDSWLEAAVDLHISGRFQVVLEGVTGTDNRTRVSVDDVFLDPGCCLGEPSTTSSPTTVGTSPTGESPTTGSPTSEVPCQTGRGTCSASGDPHYNTFDGRVHHFMGNCTYTLSKVCNASGGLPPFDVSTTNEHRGSNTKVSYVKSVNVDVYGTQISLLQNRKVNVNGTRRNLPVEIENKIKIQVSGGYVLLETDFGLWVRFDGNHYAEVSVPCDYRGQLCGLCGNYNGDPKDDNRKPNGSIAADSTELGESWLAVENNTVCSPDESGICHPELESEARKNTACGMITDPTGIFKDCHAHVAPDQFLENCVYDWCYTDDKTASLCHGLQAYAESCTNAGVCREWRNSTLCPISCAEGSQYKSCGSRCPSSCVTPSAFSPCSSLPVEGCFCKEGYTLSGDTCVLESQCGCVDENNHYHQLNESWFPRDTCKERCSCHGNNSITCTAWECGALEECRVQDGVLGCYPSGETTSTSSPTTVDTSPSDSTTEQGTSPPTETTPHHTTSIPADASTTGESPTTASPTTEGPCQTGVRGTCSASGDPHYNTFDGRVHHFMGNCTYTLSKVCNASGGLPPFDVSTTNEHRGSNTKVSYVKSVHVEVYGTQISLLKNRKVNVNGTRRNLPVEIENKIKIQVSGGYVLLETDFGLWVRFDGNHYAEVSVPCDYQGQLCGLCGNYNGDPKDDNRKPNGSIAADSTELGESWLAVENNTVCSPDESGICDPELESEARKNTACGMITDPSGIFKDCHAHVAPDQFLENCVYDWCYTDDKTASLCHGLQAYAESCTNAGVCREWRNSTLCPISCAEGSQYKSCGSRCPSSCVTPSAFSPCSSLPVEGCFCKEGYTLSGDTCVPESQCGCVDENNHYHQLNESWFPRDTCKERCSCHGNNSITCTAWECGALEECRVQDGVLGCYPYGETTSTSSPTTVDTSPSDSTTEQGTSPPTETTPHHTTSIPADASTTGESPTTASPTTEGPCQTGVRGTCSASGDPHYNTFDGRVHHFMGNCTYTLSKVCNASGGLPPFDVSTTNEHRGSNTKVSYVKSVHVEVYGTQISLLKNRKVNVNGTRRNLPVEIENKIKIQVSGGYVLLETDFGLWVRFDGNHYAEVSVPCDYQGQLCGLCGNYNGDPKDDNRKPNGSIAADSTELGESWLAVENNTVCSPDEPGICDPELESEARKNTACGMITDPSGIFKDCHGHVAPQQFLENCVYDMCHTDDPTASLCNGLQAYAESCTNAGICREWRNSTLCPISCPGGSQYKACGSRCPSSCVTPSEFSPCSSLPVEGCFCKEGYTLSGDICVPEIQCGCVDGNNHYHQLNESWFPRDTCKERCSCHGNNSITCTAWECGALEECRVQDGVLGCYPSGEPSTTSSPTIVGTSPSDSTTEKGTSSPTETTPHHTTSTPADASTTGESPTTASPTTEDPCQTGVRGTCSASGDPHYNTFDGRVHHFMGNCTYTLSKVCNASGGLPPFDVSTTNEHRGSNTKVSYVKSVNVEVYGTQISLLKNRKVNVNGTRRNLPVEIENKIKIQISGGYVLLETDFGLWVRFDGNHYAEVSVPCDYQGQLCGLCGNYNGDPKDDNRKPNGSIAADSTELGESWLVVENNTVCSPDEPGICDPQLESEARKNTACGMITDPSGIFKDCHGHVAPQQFLENCVYDMCHTDDPTASLCNGLQAYAESCTNAGICREWRNSTLCPISCPGGSQYKACGSRCPSSCVTPSAFSPCSSLPVEGCFCEEGYTLSGDTCVPESKCGCVDGNNHYHQLGESWFTHDACKERCTCNSNNSIACAAWECGTLEECRVEEGVLGCYSSGRASCQVAGDPHYFTFDKVMHTFLGTCTYTLMKVCNSSSVVPVTISGKNEERGLRGATYLKEVYIDVYGNRITLQKDRAILFNKERIRTPVKNRLRGVSIGNVGIYLVVETDFGLLVKYDGNQHLEISLPKSYFSKVCGMCGNYNDQRGDELLMPNGMQASNVTQFGNSWKVQADSDAGCLPDTREDLGPPCSVEDKPVVEKQCNVLKSDIFKPCHHLVEPDLFIQTCVYDMCKYNGMLSTLCGIAQAYVDTCKQQGVILKWRNSTFCPLPCPSNSYYTDCASPCPATCNDIYAPSLCEKPDECAEGCVCSEGYVLSDDQCVPLSECGCRDKDDSYYSAGESWITAHCTYKCKCQKDNIIKCQPYGCDASEVCVLNNKGKYHCKPTGFGKCLVIGDPHYMTFDGLMHHFQGKKTYVLSQTVSSISDRLPAFSIEGKNKLVTKRPDLSFLQEIHISVYNHTVWLGQKKQLVVDGVNTIPPAQPHEGLRIYQKPMRIYLETDFGLSLSYDGVENLDMVLANTYKNKVEGLCGNFDGKYKNDFTKPDGTRVQDVDVFGESWKVPVTRTVSRRRRDVLSDEQLDALELNTGLTRGCSSSQLSLVNSTSKCGILTDPNGPFAKCHPNVSVSFSQMGCVFDLCAEADNSAVLCRHLEQYAQTCQQNGVTLENWRQQTSCEMQCPLNSKYSSCMSACPDSCSNLAASSECEAPCVEGCECLSGYVLSGYNCVPYKACGCTFLGTYYQAGEKFTTEDCSQTCVCTESSSIACSRATCARSEICAVANFTRGCYAPGPCLADPCDNGGICTEATDQSSNSSANFSCVCPEGYQGLRCEDEVITQVNKPKPPVDPLVYILVGIAAGILVLAVLIALAVWLAKSRNNRKNALEFPRRNLSLNQSRDSLDQDTHRPDYNYMVNAAFAQDENQPRFN